MIYNRKIAALMALGLGSVTAWGQEVPKQEDKSEWLRSFKTEQSQKAVDEKVAAIQKAKLLKLPLKFKNNDGRVGELVSFNGDIPVYRTTTNAVSAATIGSSKLYPGGGGGLNLTGSGTTFSEWDGGAVLNTHVEFGTRVTQMDGATTTNDHATHVAGTMIASGVNPSAKGMSYQGTLQAYDFNNHLSELSTTNTLLSNHSYGDLTGWDYGSYYGPTGYYWFGDPAISAVEDYRFGFYNSEAQAWDQLIVNKPNHLSVKAASNDRNNAVPAGTPHYFVSGNNLYYGNAIRNNDGNGTGFNTITDAGNSKNVLTVGAVDDIPAGYSGPSSVIMSDFSSWGPTDDGRVKPDIVANGIGLFSPINLNNTSYGTSSGTSMASPSATGSLGLLLHHERNLFGSNTFQASTLKALAIHTADDAGNAGPDYKFGWGLMNTESAAKVMTQHAAFCRHIKEFSLDNGNTIELEVNKIFNLNLKVTICWTDPAGTSPAPSLNPTTKMLVNDLDTRVISSVSGLSYSPFVLGGLANPNAVATTGDNSIDNVEQVIVTNQAVGKYKIRISHKGTLSGGKQIVSVIITGNDGVINDMNLNNITLNSGADKTYTYRSLNVSNFKALSGSKAKFKALQAITVNTVTTFDAGSVVSLEINPTCNLATHARKDNSLGQQSQDNFNFDEMVNSNLGEEVLFAYPNPVSSGFLNFNRTVGDFKLINAAGIVVLRGSNANRIHIDELPKGLYILHLDESVHKIVIE